MNPHTATGILVTAATDAELDNRAEALRPLGEKPMRSWQFVLFGLPAALLRAQWYRPPQPCQQNTAIAAYIRWRNARAKPKNGFATGSPSPAPGPANVAGHTTDVG